MIEAFFAFSIVNTTFTISFKVIKNQKIQKQRKREKRAEMKNKKGKAPCQKEK